MLNSLLSMVQVPKDHVRDRFVAAAAEAFAELGFAATSMAAVAERAGSSVGNLYKYFESKQELFDAAVPAELVQELQRRTRARMQALGAAKDIRELGADARYHALAGELLDYCLARRAAVIVVLTRAEGTPYAGFAEKFVKSLVQWSLEYARTPYPKLEPTAELRFALHQAYTGFVAAIAAALREFPRETQTRRVIALLTTAHQGGLKRLFETEGDAHAQSRHATEPPVVATTPAPRAGDAPARGGSASPAGRGAGQAHQPRGSKRRR